MVPPPPANNIDGLIDRLFASTPLPFVKDFLRKQKEHAKQVRIGITRSDVKANLRDALLAKTIGAADVDKWLAEVEGWGRQHLYLATVPKRSLTHAHLLNKRALSHFLTKKGYINPDATGDDTLSSYFLENVEVDDELARITWRCRGIDRERHEELDETKELDDGEYEFHAFRLVPRRSASRCIIRKTDGVVVMLVDLPLGDEHDSMNERVGEVARAVLAPLTVETVYLAPIVSALDGGAVAAFGPRPTRHLKLGVAPTQARYRTDGARLEFKSTRESSGYTDSVPVRHVRRAMQVEQFEGESGKFRLTFEGANHAVHDMMVSLNSANNRTFLFSRMTETEVLALVDQVMSLVPLGTRG
jgi:hypothetical protein